jgi:hypothetical protein
MMLSVLNLSRKSFPVSNNKLVSPVLRYRLSPAIGPVFEPFISEPDISKQEILVCYLTPEMTSRSNILTITTRFDISKIYIPSSLNPVLSNSVRSTNVRSLEFSTSATVRGETGS